MLFLDEEIIVGSTASFDFTDYLTQRAVDLHKCQRQNSALQGELGHAQQLHSFS